MNENDLILFLSDRLYHESIEEIENEEDIEMEKQMFRDLRNIMDMVWAGIKEDLDHEMKHVWPIIHRKIRWYFADKYNDEHLIDELIEEENVLAEKNYNELMNQMEDI